MADVVHQDIVFSSFEPTVTNRFVVELPESLGIPSYLIKRVEGLQYHTCALTHVSLHLYNQVGPSTEKALYDNIIFKKLEAIECITIKQLDPIGDIVQTTTLQNCKIGSITFADLDWSKCEPTITILNVEPESIEIK